MTLVAPVTLVAPIVLTCTAGHTAELQARDDSGEWTLWHAYAERFMAADGRIIDGVAQDHSTSEGQSYGMFFALVANDCGRFDKLLDWTINNLAAGDLARNLPAWRWGKRAEGDWGVLDPNPASDADMWIAYALLEAGRLWKRTDLERLAHRVLANIVSSELVYLPDLGPMVLPGPFGFDQPPGTWRLNPSYLPLQLLRRFAKADATGPWSKLIGTTVRMATAATPKGIFPDWIAYQAGKGFVVDPEKGPVGSYDAIRNYLWTGLLPEGEPHRATLLKAGSGMVRLTQKLGHVAEKIDTRNVARSKRGSGPVGFTASLIASARASHNLKLAARLQADVDNKKNGELYGEPVVYYNQNLILFARGHEEGRYRFAEDGSLIVPWSRACTD